MWAMLTAYQALRRAMVTAIESRPGTDPDRASFTTALHTARDLLVHADGIAVAGSAGVSTEGGQGPASCRAAGAGRRRVRLRGSNEAREPYSPAVLSRYWGETVKA